MFRQKHFDRIRQLNDQHAIDARLVDEKEDQLEAAQGAEYAAKEQVSTAHSQAEAANAKVTQAMADLDEAKAEVEVAAAELAKSKVFLDYTVITSPYDGVITKRNFYPGDFIRGADSSGSHPALLSVERTDLMRVVVQVPDRDVPYVSVGEKATLEIDALPGRTFRAVVNRYAQAEDLSTRLMRTELDVPNPDGRLVRGMYGRASISLDPGAAQAVRIPIGALSGKAEGGKATVRVVRDGRAHIIPVVIGTNNGVEAEVTSGLSPTDRVILQAGGTVDEGTPVAVNGSRIGQASAQ
jgi:RND family efflux transporter MFP subunit